MSSNRVVQKTRLSLESLEARRLLTADIPGYDPLGSSIPPAPIAEITNEWLIRHTSESDLLATMLGHEIESIQESDFVPDSYVVNFTQELSSDLQSEFEALDQVDSAVPLLTRHLNTKAVPNDPFFPQQWHLANTGQTGGLVGADVNVTKVWDDYSGSGVVISIIDDGVELTHPDLSTNARPDLSHDYCGNDSNPAPGTFDNHGTAVAGVAAATGDNGIGVSGSAPGADLAGIRLIACGFNDTTEARALSHGLDSVDIYNNSWGPSDNGWVHSIGPQALAALQNGATAGRNGLGAIYTWAAGNGLLSNDNVNYDPYANSRYTLAVSAIDHNGRQSWYSEPGAPILVAAYSNSPGIVTTDQSGARGYNAGGGGNLSDAAYTNDFGGTSSATPLASGVLALILEANPNLTYRDVQYILVNTSAQNDANDRDWARNAAGFLNNHKYGYGAIDAYAAVELAKIHPQSAITAEQSWSSPVQSVATPIPDGDTTGIESTITVPSDASTADLSVEWVEVQFNATHTYRGNLEVVLTSPSGTESVLAERRTNDSGDDYNYMFTSARHWGESPAGDWKLTVRDLSNGNTGTWNNWGLSFHGMDQPVQVDLGSHRPQFMEGGNAVVLAPDATAQTSADYDGFTIRAEVKQALSGDQIIPISTGTGPGEVSFAGGSIFYEGLEIGTYHSDGPWFQATLNNLASAPSTAEVLRSVAFFNPEGNLTLGSRSVEWTFAFSERVTSDVDVVPANDPPVLQNVVLSQIFEDSTSPTFRKLSDELVTFFTDVDSGSSISGLAVVGSTPNLSQGEWFFSSNSGTSWQPIGSITNLSESIVLSANSALGFIPSPDYFGQPDSLSVRALDNTYDGGFSSSVLNSRVPLAPEYIHTTGPASNTALLTIDVTNVNDAPVATSQGLSLEVLQNEQLFEVFPDTLFTDIDSPNLTWTVQGAFGDWLTLFSDTRTLVANPENRHVGTHNLLLVATDGNGAQATIPLQLIVHNVNDAPVDVRISNRSFSESDRPQAIAFVSASDPDLGDELSWAVSDPRFAVIDRELWAIEPIDYEAERTVPIILTARDNGVPSLSEDLFVELNVNDVNEFSPQITLNDVTISEDTPIGTVVATVSAVDGDFGSTVSFALKGADAEHFAIDPNSGIVTLLAELDFNQQERYKLFVEASDNGQPPFSSLAQMQVNIERVNRTPPQVPSPQQFSIAENSLAGQVVGQIEASDPDNHELVYEIRGTSQFEVDPQTGTLVVANGATLDFETQTSHSIQLVVTEDVEPFRQTFGNVIVNITDVEDDVLDVQLAGSPSVLTDRQGLSIGGLVVTSNSVATNRYSVTPLDNRFVIANNTLELELNSHLSSADAGTFVLLLQLTDNNGLRDPETLQVSFEVVAIPSPWMNPDLALDVNKDGFVTALDAIIVINELNTTANNQLSNPRANSELSLPDFDANGDQFLTSLDALLIINSLNQNAEGEQSGHEQSTDLYFDLSDEEEEDVFGQSL